MDLSMSKIVTDPSALDGLSFGGGGERVKWAAGTYMGTIEKAENAPTRSGGYCPIVQLKVFRVVQSENPNAEQEFAGKTIKCRDNINTKNKDVNNIHLASLYRLLKICGKAQAWAEWVSLLSKANHMITENTLMSFIHDNCKGAVVTFSLKPQRTPSTDGNEYFDHEYLITDAPARVTTAPSDSAPAAPAQAAPVSDFPM